MPAVDWRKPACDTLGDLVDWAAAGPQRDLLCLPGIGRKMFADIVGELKSLGVPAQLRRILAGPYFAP